MQGWGLFRIFNHGKSYSLRSFRKLERQVIVKSLNCSPTWEEISLVFFPFFICWLVEFRKHLLLFFLSSLMNFNFWTKFLIWGNPEITKWHSCSTRITNFKTGSDYRFTICHFLQLYQNIWASATSSQGFSVAVQSSFLSISRPVIEVILQIYHKPFPDLVNASWLGIVSWGIWASQKRRYILHE